MLTRFSTLKDAAGLNLGCNPVLLASTASAKLDAALFRPALLWLSLSHRR
jgi:hypothetical protein